MFLLNFFESKIATRNVTIQSTPDFDNHTVFIKEPVIHGVLINIFNNALYWIKNSEKKLIELDYNESKIAVYTEIFNEKYINKI